ncbi:MAG: preprotein translocase subunit SecG [Clostridia bacterium]|nr:preprotein translocase subunit SecG [Clostridia bacterium]
MTIWEYVIGAVLIVMALLVIAVILLQEGREANLGVISGAADSFMEKGKARTLDAFLQKWTKVISIGFFVLVFAGMLVTQFLGA